MKQASYYQTGLGSAFLSRARIIFSVTFVLFISATTATAYAGISSGELEKTLIKPTKEFFAQVGQAVTTLSENPPPHVSTSTDSSSSTQIEINTHTNTSTSDGQSGIINTYEYSYPTPISSDVWLQQVQEENLKKTMEWQQQQEALKKQSEQNMLQFKQQSDQDMEEFKQQGQQDMLQFQQQSQQNIELFKQQNGIR